MTLRKKKKTVSIQSTARSRSNFRIQKLVRTMPGHYEVTTNAGPPAEHAEAVNHPGHYGGDSTYEVIKVLAAWGLESDALLWNAVKYIARAGRKDPTKLVQDLEKAEFYLHRRITDLKTEKGRTP